MPPFGLAYAFAHQRAVEAAAKVASAKAASAPAGSAWITGISGYLAPVADTVLRYVQTDGGLLSNADYRASIASTVLATGAVMEAVVTKHRCNSALLAKDSQLRQVQEEVTAKQRRIDELQLEFEELSARRSTALRHSLVKGDRLQRQSDMLRVKLARFESMARQAVEAQRRARLQLEQAPADLARVEHENIRMREVLVKKEGEIKEALTRATTEESETSGRHHARMDDLYRVLRQSEMTIEENRVKMADFVDNIVMQRETSDGLSQQVKI